MTAKCAGGDAYSLIQPFVFDLNLVEFVMSLLKLALTDFAVFISWSV